jgi:hypothetical protein
MSNMDARNDTAWANVPIAESPSISIQGHRSLLSVEECPQQACMAASARQAPARALAMSRTALAWDER